MKVSDVSYSLQGEGPAMGRPAVIVSFAGCNLSCEDCDAPRVKEQEYSVCGLVSRIREHIGRHGRNVRVVLTGGEPTIQDRDELNALIANLADLSIDVDIETNGIEKIDDSTLRVLRYVVVSPKRDYFKQPKQRREYFKWWKLHHGNVLFKFVIGKSPWMWSEAEVKDVILQESLDRYSVWVMPAGATPQELNITGPKAWKIAARLGVNFSGRLQVMNRR